MSGNRFGDRDRRRTQAAQIAQGYRTAHEVISGALSLGVLAWLGYWLDQRFGSSPVLTILGSCLGFLVAGASLRQLLRRLDHESAKHRNESSSQSSAGVEKENHSS